MILLFTDYGLEGPYVGQLKAVAATLAPTVPVHDLMHDAPRFNPRASAYLLAALLPHLPQGAAVAAVVDPGVGGPREAVVAEVAGRHFIAPGNGLLDMLLRHHGGALWRLDWRPGPLSASFHGRDLFVPAACQLALGAELGSDLEANQSDASLFPGADWPDDVAEVIYVDGFGNAVTGLRASRAGAAEAEVETPDGWRRLKRVTTFSDVPEGKPLYYENSIGLMEVAVNQGSAAEALEIGIGSRLRLVS